MPKKRNLITPRTGASEIGIFYVSACPDKSTIVISQARLEGISAMRSKLVSGVVGVVAILCAAVSFGMAPSRADADPPGMGLRVMHNVGAPPLCVARGQNALTVAGWRHLEVIHGRYIFASAGDNSAGIACSDSESAVVAVTGLRLTPQDQINMVNSIADRF
jgi:hypothetical protein